MAIVFQMINISKLSSYGQSTEKVEFSFTFLIFLATIFFIPFPTNIGPGQLSRCSDSLRVGQSEDRTLRQ
jgi:hypothetical protein